MDNIYALNGYLTSFDNTSCFMSVLLMVFQAVLVPLPYTTLMESNNYVFGQINGLIISWIGLIAGSVACFLIVRLLFRSFIVSLVKKYKFTKVDNFIRKNGDSIVIISRFCMFLPFDFVSYMFGLTSVKLSSYIRATVLGAIPYLIIHSYLGVSIINNIKYIIYSFFAVIAVLVLILLSKKYKNDN